MRQSGDALGAAQTASDGLRRPRVPARRRASASAQTSARWSGSGRGVVTAGGGGAPGGGGACFVNLTVFGMGQAAGCDSFGGGIGALKEYVVAKSPARGKKS